ncbi:hypothetical protein DFH29DRAFT_1050737 [Suillus ampliporus]|nr:hypothetical protein DFH29DRAFT_1050737 [Suillus ampliporus]
MNTETPLVYALSSNKGQASDHEERQFVELRKPRKIHHGGRDASHPRRPNNKRLPPELLLMIFEHVYEDNMVNGEWAPGSSPSPTQFPFALAAVCKDWKNVLEMVPRFWTRIIINLDTAKLSNVNTYLRLSRDLPFEITVTRDQRVVSRSRTNNRDEGARAAEVMARIAPSLYRCKSLCFKLVHSSSLPALRHLNAIAPLLERLKLQCGIDDGEHLLVGSEVPERWSFFTPRLRHLFLNGRNFRDACALRWVERLPRLENLYVSRYSGGKHQGGDLHLHNVLVVVDRLHRRFGRLEKLTLQDISFDGILTRNPGYDIHIDAMSLQSISVPTARAIFRSKTGRAPRLVHIKHENAPISNIQLTQADTLVLEGPLTRMTEGISIWNGSCLSIKNCPSFNDHTIRDIYRTWDPDALTSPNWNQLKIEGCTDFSADALLELFDARFDVVQQARNQIQDPNSQLAIRNVLILQVHGGPPISPGVVELFQAKLPIFDWHEAATGITH